ncbi:MAG: hypothetical protein U0Q03_17990 [Acidimicrobiales bacterium]
MHLTAADGLTASFDPDGSLRVRWGEPDWFGPGRLTIGGASIGLDPSAFEARDVDAAHDDHGAGRLVEVHRGDVVVSVRALDDHPMIVLRVEATRDLQGLATGAFEQPTVGWPVFTPADRLADGVDPAARALVHQFTEFGLPCGAGTSLDGFPLLPIRPPVGWPLSLVARDGRTLTIVPLDAFHEQTIGLNGGTVRCGWHGDLDEVPAGFATELAVIAGPDLRTNLDRWGALLQRRAGTRRPGRWPDALGSKPSYWTDNGAAYWYRTEPGHTPADSVVAAVDDLLARGVPLGSVQLDSWWYPHAELRPFDTTEWVVPPTAMLAWEPRPDVLPDGIPALRDRLRPLPLVAHIRHLSSAAPIASEVPVAIDGPYAVPTTPEAYERWLDQCVAWDIETFEHDWLVEVFFGNRWLRSAPGRARAWQEGIDRAAAERGITLQWCMATPADMAQTVTLRQVTSIRTSGDHGYIATPGQLWAWFCTTSAIARSLGLMPFKDVFRADPEVAGDHGEPEALLSALSTGPVGLGDRVARFDPALAMRTCRADGTLIKPHVPVAATSASMTNGSASRSVLMVAECHSEHPAGRWAYVTTMRCSPGDRRTTGEVRLDALGESRPTGDVVVWDWRSGTATRMAADGSWTCELGQEEWTFHVVAPVLAGEVAVIGDTSKFVTAGDARVVVSDTGDAVRVVVKGADEQVTVTGWSAQAVRRADGSPVAHDASTGVWTTVVDVPSRGWTTIALTA